MKNSHFEGLRTCVFVVNDLTAARDWYAKILGQDAYFDEPFYVGFNVSGYELGLVPNENEAKVGETVQIYWGVSKIEESFERLLSLGATVYESPTDVGGGIKTAIVRDPWGNLFGIIFNPHFKLA